MRFTFWAVGAPLLLGLVAALFSLDKSLTSLAGLTALVWGPWFLIGCPVVAVYWTVRLVRYAWRDEPRPDVASEPTKSGSVLGL